MSTINYALSDRGVWIPYRRRAFSFCYHILLKNGDIHLGMYPNGTQWHSYISRDNSNIRFSEEMLKTVPMKRHRMAAHNHPIASTEVKAIWIMTEEEIQENGIEDMPIFKRGIVENET